MSDKFDYILDYLGETVKTETIVKFDIRNKTVYGYTGKVDVLMLPNITTQISDNAFSNHTEIKKICIGSNTKKIGKGAFKGCTNLEEIVWSDSVTHIDDEAFMGCTSLKRIVFPNSLKEIGDSAFEHCIRLEKVILPKSLQTIGLLAFKETAIRNIEIPEKVKLVCFGAFVYCKNLNTITILYDTPQSKKRMEDKGLDWVYSSSYAFKVPKSKGGWSSEWNYRTNYEGYNSRYDYVFKRVLGDFVVEDYDPKIIIGYTGAGGDLVFPDKIERIRSSAFKGNSNITSVLFNSKIRIEENAFSMCSSLETIQFNAGIEKLDPYAFSHCDKLRSVIFEEADRPNFWASIEDNCFLDCRNLSNVTLSHSVREIGVSSFKGCNLKSFYVPNSIKSISNYAFANNKNLTTIIFEEDEHGSHCCDSYSYYTRYWNAIDDNASSYLEYYTIPSDVVGSYRSMRVGTYNRLDIRSDGTCYFDGLSVSECDFSDLSSTRRNYVSNTGTWSRKGDKITIIPDDSPSTRITATIEQYGTIEIYHLSYKKQK